MCLHCGAEFTRPSPVGRVPVYCSVDCRARAGNARRGPRRKPVVVECRFCSTPFERVPHVRTWYCSPECAEAAARVADTLAHRERRGAPVDDEPPDGELAAQARGALARYAAMGLVADGDELIHKLAARVAW